jgi:hypothetical protein
VENGECDSYRGAGEMNLDFGVDIMNIFNLDAKY